VKDTSSKITIVVPFRNIHGDDHSVDPSFLNFLHSLELISNCVEEVILVNDHSTDASLISLASFQMNNWKLLSLQNESYGKKAALDLGIQEAKTEYIWTLDSDVQLVNFDSIGFQEFQYNLKRDLIILPVIMKTGKRLLDAAQFNEWRYMQWLTKLSAQLKMPMMCNGANLIFRRTVFLQHIHAHCSVSSGDDLFLMSHVLKSKGDIGLYWKGFVDVEINPVQSLNEAVDQRIRWAGKTTKLPFTRSTILHFFFTLFSALHAMALVGICIPSIQRVSLVFLLLKIGLEVIGVLCVFPNRMKGKEIIVLVPQMLVYPFFSLCIFISSLFFVPKWKGRRVSLK
jgi:glycosyltransferase involved in cell wall biosynthesis